MTAMTQTELKEIAKRAIDALVALGSPTSCDVVALLTEMAEQRSLTRKD